MEVESTASLMCYVQCLVTLLVLDKHRRQKNRLVETQVMFITITKNWHRKNPNRNTTIDILLELLHL